MRAGGPLVGRAIASELRGSEGTEWEQVGFFLFVQRLVTVCDAAAGVRSGSGPEDRAIVVQGASREQWRT